MKNNCLNCGWGQHDWNHYMDCNYVFPDEVKKYLPKSVTFYVIDENSKFTRKKCPCWKPQEADNAKA